MGERVHLSDCPGLIIEATPYADPGDTTGAGRAADGLVGRDVRAVEIQDREGIGGDQPPGGGRVAIEDAAAQGVAAVAAHAAGPTLGQVAANGAADEFEGRRLDGEPAVIDAAADGV